MSLLRFDRDDTTVTSRAAAARPLDRMLAAGSRAVIVTGTNLGNVARQLGSSAARQLCEADLPVPVLRG